MSKEYLPDKEKRILLSALSHEMKLVKDNNLTELIPVVKNLDYKFMYDRLFKQIENNAYQQGRADQKEEDNSFFNFDKAIEAECNKARADEYNRIVDIIKSMQETAQAMAWIEYDVACEKILKAIEKGQE